MVVLRDVLRSLLYSYILFFIYYVLAIQFPLYDSLYSNPFCDCWFRGKVACDSPNFQFNEIIIVSPGEGTLPFDTKPSKWAKPHFAGTGNKNFATGSLQEIQSNTTPISTPWMLMKNIYGIWEDIDPVL